MLVWYSWYIYIYWFHALACRGPHNNCHLRHEMVAKAVHYLALNAGFRATLNAKLHCLSSLRSDARSLRPADILIAGDSYRSTCIDVTIPSPVCKSNMTHRTGEIVNIRAKEKLAKYLEVCTAHNLGFSPFVIDCCGVLHSEAWKLLQRFASSHADQSSRPYSYCIAICRRRISFSLHNGLALQLYPLLDHLDEPMRQVVSS